MKITKVDFEYIANKKQHDYILKGITNKTIKKNNTRMCSTIGGKNIGLFVFTIIFF